jgi:hypothetical protein
MQSPFPGMDPYLEASWRDVHARLVVYATDHVNEQPKGAAVVARINRRQGPRGAGDAETPEETFIEILDTSGRPVTAIEFMTPTTRSPQCVDYREKRMQRERRGVSFVEIDLLRGAEWMAWLNVPAVHQATYRVIITVPGQVRLHRISLQERLPTIGIPPLSLGDAIVLDLEAIVQHAYESGDYAETINYRQPPVPPLEGEDAVWADQLLKNAGKR